MLVYVFAVAVLNLGLGFALAAWRERQLVHALPAGELSRAFAQPEPAAPPEQPVLPAPKEAPAPSAPPVEPPPEAVAGWEEVFGAAFALEIGDCRRRLLALQQQAAQCTDVVTMHALMAEFDASNRMWSSSADHACRLLEQGRETLGDLLPEAERLIELLSRIAQRVGVVSEFLTSANEDESPAAVCQRMRDDADGLLEDLQHLRDERYEVRLAVLRHAGGLDALPRSQLVDPQTSLHNRLGLEAVYRQWRNENPDQPWSVAVLDIDDFAAWNRRLGVAGGDRLLTAFAGLADDLLRKDRGFDRAARGRGDSLVLFLGETDADPSVNAAERIRQTIEASAFALESGQAELTVSVGVAAGHGNALDEALSQAEQAARFAKDQGGNRTCRYAAEGPAAEPPRAYQVKGRVVKVDAAG